MAMREMPEAEVPEGEEIVPELRELRIIRRLIITITLLLAAAATYFARDVLFPVVLAVVLTLTLRPATRGGERIGIPAVVSGTILVIGFGVALAVAAWSMSGPVSELAERAPEIGRELRWKLRGLIAQVSAMKEAGEQVAEIAQGGSGQTEVQVDQSGLIPQAVGSVASVGSSVVAALVLTMFLLASGDFYHRRIVEASPSLTDKKRALSIVRHVERDVSRYLGAITVINAGLGVAIGTGLWLVGVPMAPLWGVFAFLANYIPFLGAIIGTLAVGMVGVVTFDTVGQALLPPLIYFSLTSFEGQVVTPMLVGRRLELNTATVFVTVIFWIWLWGVPGAILAVPFLVIVKAVADNVPALHSFASFLANEPRR